MEARLHGPAAAEAIGIYARLGASGARFDGRRVANAVRSARGRVRLSYALRAASSRFTRITVPAPRRREMRSTRRVVRRVASSGGGSSPRPRLAASPSGGDRG